MMATAQVEAALRVYFEYQYVKPNAAAAGFRRRSALCAARDSVWTSERIGFYAAMAWRVEAALDVAALDDAMREALRLRYGDGIGMDGARAVAAPDIGREAFRRALMRAVGRVGECLELEAGSPP